MSDVARSVSLTGTGADTIDVIGNVLDVAVSGTFVGTVIVERQLPGSSAWIPVTGASFTAVGGGTFTSGAVCKWRANCTAFTSGTIVVTAVASTRT